jgi:hypothetical protein
MRSLRIRPRLFIAAFLAARAALELCIQEIISEHDWAMT